MSGRIKIGALGLVLILAAVPAGVTPGITADDPCGGHYVGRGLKAVYSSSYTDGGVDFVSTITNDIPDLPYQYAVPSGDCVFYFRNSHIIVGTDRLRNNRYVKMHFEGEQKVPTNSICAPNPYFLGSNIDETSWPRWFQFRTAGGYTFSHDGAGKLILRPSGTYFNWMGMAPGDVGYCDSGLKFAVMDDPQTGDVDESLDEYWTTGDVSQVKVVCTMVNGKLGWVLTPVSEPFTVIKETRTKKGVIVTSTSYDHALLRPLISNMRTICLHGSFLFLFELKIETL